MLDVKVTEGYATERSPQLEMRWAPVTDELGVTRMEAVWVEVGATPTSHAYRAA